MALLVVWIDQIINIYNFTKNLAWYEVSNVVLYESSRKNIEINPSITDIYKQKQAKFIWKTFSNELQDVRNVINEIITNSVELDKLEITLNWNSLWGILAFYLAQEFSQVKTIVSVWTWLRLGIKNVPILDTFSNIEELTEKLQSFKWKYVSFLVLKMMLSLAKVLKIY